MDCLAITRGAKKINRVLWLREKRALAGILKEVDSGVTREHLTPLMRVMRPPQAHHGPRFWRLQCLESHIGNSVRWGRMCAWQQLWVLLIQKAQSSKSSSCRKVSRPHPLILARSWSRSFCPSRAFGKTGCCWWIHFALFKSLVRCCCCLWHVELCSSAGFLKVEFF